MEKRPAKKDKNRTEAFGRRREIWNEKKQQRTLDLQNLYGKAVKTFDVYGRPLAPGDDRERDIPGEDVRLALERALSATADPIFADALAALQSYGLAGGQPRTSHVAARHINFGDVGRPYVENMKWFIDQRNYSERDAAEEVAAFYFVDGKTFTTVVNSLRARFSEWKKSGFQIEETNDSGDIGYNVRVRPVNGRIVYMPGRPDPVPDSGVTVVFTNYWRRSIWSFGRFSSLLQYRLNCLARFGHGSASLKFISSPLAPSDEGAPLTAYRT